MIVTGERSPVTVYAYFSIYSGCSTFSEIYPVIWVSDDGSYSMDCISVGDVCVGQSDMDTTKVSCDSYPLPYFDIISSTDMGGCPTAVSPPFAICQS